MKPGNNTGLALRFVGTGIAKGLKGLGHACVVGYKAVSHEAGEFALGIKGINTSKNHMVAAPVAPEAPAASVAPVAPITQPKKGKAK